MKQLLIDSLVLKGGSTNSFLNVKTLIDNNLIVGQPSSDKLKIPVLRKLMHDIDAFYDVMNEDPIANEKILNAVDSFKRDSQCRREVVAEVAALCWEDYSGRAPSSAPVMGMGAN